MKKKRYVFVVQHLRTIADCDDLKMIGVFSSKKEALLAKRKLLKRPGFKIHRRGFFLDKYEVDFIHWDKGFRTV